MQHVIFFININIIHIRKIIGLMQNIYNTDILKKLTI